jgi:protein tyrosine phosphatase (PTP) superfamily phosphohydrolase (DUF442 family)
MTEIMKQEITNYLQISPTLATAGQPTREQFSAIKAAGYDIVINLVPPISAESLPDEREIVTGLGMEYIHIPVIWENPTCNDLNAFFAAMNRHDHKKIFVHCVLNMRVSVFVFLYRILVQGVTAETARQTLIKIWEPNPIWRKFIDENLNYK